MKEWITYALNLVSRLNRLQPDSGLYFAIRMRMMSTTSLKRYHIILFMDFYWLYLFWSWTCFALRVKNQKKCELIERFFLLRVCLVSKFSSCLRSCLTKKKDQCSLVKLWSIPRKKKIARFFHERIVHTFLNQSKQWLHAAFLAQGERKRCINSYGILTSSQLILQ